MGRKKNIPFGVREKRRIARDILKTGLESLNDKIKSSRGKHFVALIQKQSPKKQYVIFLGVILLHTNKIKNAFPKDRVRAALQKNYRMPVELLYKKTEHDADFIVCKEEELYLHNPQKIETEKQDCLPWKYSDLFFTELPAETRDLFEKKELQTIFEFAVGEQECEELLKNMTDKATAAKIKNLFSSHGNRN